MRSKIPEQVKLLLRKIEGAKAQLKIMQMGIKAVNNTHLFQVLQIIRNYVTAR